MGYTVIDKNALWILKHMETSIDLCDDVAKSKRGGIKGQTEGNMLSSSDLQ